MILKDILKELDNETRNIHSSEFKIDVNTLYEVPRTDNKNISNINLNDKSRKVVSLETCILCVEIRKSTELNMDNDLEDVIKLYSAFENSMTKIAQFYNGTIANISNDCITILFDEENAYSNAVNTSMAMNTIAQEIISRKFKRSEFTCGIGIASGKAILILSQYNNAKKVTCIGETIDLAMKLTKEANTSQEDTSTLQILLTKDVYDGFEKENPNAHSIKKQWWKVQNREISNYEDKIYGGDVTKIW